MSGTGSPSVTPSVTPSFNTTLDALGDKATYSDYVEGSVGINIPQIIVAGIEAAGLGANMKDAAILAGCVGISNLLPAYGASKAWGSASEKYIAEPLLAGALFTAASAFMKSDKNLVKAFAKSVIIGSSSAGIAGALYSATMAKERVPSMYSYRGAGLRGTVNAPSYPQVVVS